MVQRSIIKKVVSQEAESPMPVHALPHIAIMSRDFWTFGDTITTVRSPAAVDNTKTTPTRVSLPKFKQQRQLVGRARQGLRNVILIIFFYPFSFCDL